MSDQDIDDAPDEDGIVEELRERRGLSGKRLVLMFILPGLAVLAVAGGGTAISLGVLRGGEAVEEVAAAVDEEVLFYDLPEILVNLNTGAKQASYLKIRVALELDDPEAIPVIESLMPRVIDNFQVYLRELRREDLSGSAGIYRLKEELLVRVNTAVHPARINDVLFKEMLVQ